MLTVQATAVLKDRNKHSKAMLSRHKIFGEILEEIFLQNRIPILCAAKLQLKNTAYKHGLTNHFAAGKCCFVTCGTFPCLMEE
jgi:hypothetical protein